MVCIYERKLVSDTLMHQCIRYLMDPAFLDLKHVCCLSKLMEAVGQERDSHPGARKSMTGYFDHMSHLVASAEFLQDGTRSILEVRPCCLVSKSAKVIVEILQHAAACNSRCSRGHLVNGTFAWTCSSVHGQCSELFICAVDQCEIPHLLEICGPAITAQTA